METITTTQRKLPNFVEILPDGRWKLTLDNHLLQTYATCERLFQYKHIDNIALKGGRSIKIELGSWFALVMQDYYEAFGQGVLTEELVMRSAAARWVELNMDEFAQLDNKNFSDFGGRAGALALARQYFLFYKDVDQRSLKVVAAEASFGGEQVPVAENDDVVLYLSGIPDLVVLEDGKHLAPFDTKTKDHLTPQVLSEFKPSGQFIGYCVAVRALADQLGYDYDVNYCVVNAVARLVPSTPRDKSKQPTPRFSRLRVSFSADEVREWILRRLDAATRLRMAIIYNEFHMTDNEVSCHRHYGRPCAYRPVCVLPPEHRLLQIQSNYTNKPPWTPHRHKNGGETE